MIDIDYIRNTILKTGKPKYGKIKVSIDQGGIGCRYRAFIETPTYNTMLETPDLVDKEGILSFRERIIYDIYRIYKEFEESD